jgi:hypothetical protein
MSQFIKGDIQSMDLLSFVLLTENIDTVMHFAAQVRACSADAWLYIGCKSTDLCFTHNGKGYTPGGN